jgi:hypothetical protein
MSDAAFHAVMPDVQLTLSVACSGCGEPATVFRDPGSPRLPVCADCCDEIRGLGRRRGHPGPRVVNRHHLEGRWPPGSIYIGRPSRLAASILSVHRECDDGTALGNPFHRRQIPNAQANLEAYRAWLWERIRGGDPSLSAALGLVGDFATLVCSCKPRPCHGDVVVQAWRYLREGEVSARRFNHSTMKGAP